MRLNSNLLTVSLLFCWFSMAAATPNSLAKDYRTIEQINAIEAFTAHAGTWAGTARQFSADGTPLGSFEATYSIKVNGLDYFQTNTYYLDSGTKVFTYEAKIQEDGTLVFSQENFRAQYEATNGRWFISGSGYSENSKNERFVETVVLRKDTLPKERTRFGQFYSNGELSSYFVLNETLLED